MGKPPWTRMQVRLRSETGGAPVATRLDVRRFLAEARRRVRGKDGLGVEIETDGDQPLARLVELIDEANRAELGLLFLAHELKPWSPSTRLAEIAFPDAASPGAIVWR